MTQGEAGRQLQGWECGFYGWGTANQWFMWMQSRWSVDNKENMMMAWIPDPDSGVAGNCLAFDTAAERSPVVVQPCNELDWRQRWGWNQVW